MTLKAARTRGEVAVSEPQDAPESTDLAGAAVRDKLALVTGAMEAVRNYARENDHLLPCGRIADTLDTVILGVYEQMPSLRPKAEVCDGN